MFKFTVKAGVEFVRRELERIAPDYQLLADCLVGERAIKGGIPNNVVGHLLEYNLGSVVLRRGGNVQYGYKARTYLPMPNSGDSSAENQARYDAYVTRAVFYNAVKRTLDGYLGQLFQREPKIEVPENLAAMAYDVTGERVDLAQFAKEVVGYVLPYGRSGVLADYPETEAGVTKEQASTGSIRPVLRCYAPWDITNWRERQIGSQRVLELVVLREEYTVTGEDSFATTVHHQYRVLELSNEGVYGVSVWRKPSSGDAYVRGGRTTPRKADGSTFNRIPFFFVGAANNDPKIDSPPFVDIANVNIGHFHNSADYEESCYMVGQPTPIFSGITDEWHTEVLKGEPIMLGAQGSVSLPVGGDASLLQAASNTMPHEAMLHKEKQLVTLGARIAEIPDVMRTATEAKITAVEATSPLISTAYNVSSVITAALEVCAEFVGVTGNIVFCITTEATQQQVSPEERIQLREDWLAGIITFEEVRANLTRAGVAGISQDTEARQQMEQARERMFPQSTEPSKETDDVEA